jgi:hypothetical protein
MRKLSDDEMLVTHGAPKPAEHAERNESAEAISPEAFAMQLAAVRDADERKRVIREMQEHLGNEEAERIIQAAAKAEEK